MNYYTRRTLTLFLTMLFVVILTFSVFRIIPGNPALTILGVEATDEQIAMLAAKLGTDRPLFDQFIDWISGIALLDFGESLRFSEPVLELIGARLPVTITLAVLAMTITVGIGIPLGILAARTKGKAIDMAVSIGTQIGLAVPSFWMGIILILIFGLSSNG